MGTGGLWARSHPSTLKTFTLVNPWSYAEQQLATLQKQRIYAAKQLSPYSYTHFNSSIMFPPKYKAEYTKEFEAKALQPKGLSHNALQVGRR
tara:strand:+ start:417 stop:692 length:276 start_codon:yes stop_codon:yes gene_type:complete